MKGDIISTSYVQSDQIFIEMTHNARSETDTPLVKEMRSMSTTVAALAAHKLAEATKRLRDIKREVAQCEKEARAAFEAEGKMVQELYSYVAKEGVISELGTFAQYQAQSQRAASQPETVQEIMQAWGIGITPAEKPNTPTKLDESLASYTEARTIWGF